MTLKVGLALGAGAARGFAHIGVLRVLEQEKVPIHMLAGTSIGALIGALYAAGLTPDSLEKLALGIKRHHWLDIGVSRMGLIAGQKLESMLRLLTQNKSFDELRLPLAVVATDVENGDEVIITQGPVAQAVRASVAVPGIFSPVRMEGRLLVDGGVVDRVPARVVRQMGANVVIAVSVDACRDSQHNRVLGIFDVIIQSLDIMQRELTRVKTSDADVLIEPKVDHINPARFSQIKECIEAGAEAALSKLEQIRSALSAFQ